VIERGMRIRDREGTMFIVLCVDADCVIMQKLGTPDDVISTRTVTWEHFEKYGYSVIEE
jgi:hypothetical protein